MFELLCSLESARDWGTDSLDHNWTETLYVILEVRIVTDAMKSAGLTFYLTSCRVKSNLRYLYKLRS